RTVSPLVEIQAGDKLKPPLFLVHPVGGQVYFYRDLARHLGAEQPVYGLQAQGVNGEADPLTQVEEMAALYIEALRVRQPEEPYFLGGSSFGGMAAFEMARQLHALGRPTALLAMIDTPGLGQMPVLLEDDMEILAYLLKVGANVSVNLDHMRKLEPDEQLRYFLKEQRTMKKQMVPDLDITQVRHFLHLFKVNSRAMQAYRPQIYPGKIVFFRAREKDAYNAKSPERAWLDLAREGLEMIDVPGNHISMNEPPHVLVLAERLKAYLDFGQN
ncbi:MAG: polyketide synthase, partial [Gammaproteobacteria bacterium]|nr:polyketide synthase [Gammaproteobacteria bacterium]